LIIGYSKIKKMKILFCSFAILFAFITPAFGQELITSKNNLNFFEVRKTFYSQFENTNTKDVDGPFQKFKRWEWYWESRVDSLGNFPSLMQLIETKKKVKYDQLLSKSISGDWVPKGPFESSGQQDGMGRLNCIAFHPLDSNIFWVGAPYGGLWKTIDNGMTWSTTTDELPTVGVSDIAINPLNPDIMYIATGDNEGQAIYQVIPTGGVFKSIDGGGTWNITGWNLNLNAQISRMIINPSSPTEILVATNQGIFKTIDGGGTWTNQQTGWFKDIKFKPTNPEVVYATTYSYSGNAQIYKSTNGGDNWSQIATFDNTGRIEIAVTPANPNLLIAVCAHYPNWGLEGVYKSNNEGGAFTQLVSGDCLSTNMLTNTLAGNGCYGSAYYAITAAINPLNENEIWVGGINLWRSEDGGNNWNINTFNFPGYGKPVTHADKHYLAYNPLTPGKFYSCSDGGLQITNDQGTTWTDISNGLQIGQIYRINTSISAANQVICGLQDNGTKELVNSIWQNRIISWDGMECAFDYTNADIAYAGMQQGGLRRTLDNWQSFSNISTNINGQLYGEGAWITPFMINPINPSSLIIGYKKIYRSFDKGDNWNSLSSQLTTDYLRNLKYAKSDTNIIYATTYDSLFVSSNGGLSWSSKITGTNSSNYPRISYLTVNPINPQNIWLTYSGSSASNKVFMSNDGGNSWINISGNLPNVTVNCLEYHYPTQGIYIGTDIGVFYRDSSLNNWISFNAGLPNTVVSELEISEIDQSIWAGTYGRGLWKSDLYTPTIGIGEIENQKRFFALYPNPSSGKFIIENDANYLSSFDISVFDIYGKEIIKKTKHFGNKTELDLSHLSEGIYLISIISETHQESIKVCIKK
jgi:photosystem II stability/assembly factor-like uncharacterized protein